MKKLLAIAACLTPLFAVAQIDKGSAFVTGDINLSTRNTNPDIERINYYNVSTDLGYIFSSRWAAGVHVRFENQTFKNGSDKSYARSAFAGPFVRYYIPVTEKLFVHLDGGINFSWFRIVLIPGVPYPTLSSPAGSYEVYVRPGASYFVTDKVALQASMGGISVRAFNHNINRSQTSLDLNLNSLTLGAAFYF